MTLADIEAAMPQALFDNYSLIFFHQGIGDGAVGDFLLYNGGFQVVAVHYGAPIF